MIHTWEFYKSTHSIFFKFEVNESLKSVLFEILKAFIKLMLFIVIVGHTIWLQTVKQSYYNQTLNMSISMEAYG